VAGPVATGGVILAVTAAVTAAAGLGGIAGDAVGGRVIDRFDGGG
jgi:hypothetical protein